MSAEEHAWRFVDWVAGIAAAVASAALGFVMSSRDRLTKLEERVADHERYNLDRGPIIYSTKGRVDLLDAEIAHINKKLTEQERRGEKLQDGMDELLRRLPKE